jgi:hypothetical protein
VQAQIFTPFITKLSLKENISPVEEVKEQEELSTQDDGSFNETY